MVLLNNQILFIQFTMIVNIIQFNKINCFPMMSSGGRPMKNNSPFFTIKGPEILQGFPIPLEYIPGGSDFEFDKQTTSDEINFLFKYPFQYALNPMVRAGIGTIHKIERYGEQIPLRGNLIFRPIFRLLTQPASFNLKQPFEEV